MYKWCVQVAVTVWAWRTKCAFWIWVEMQKNWQERIWQRQKKSCFSYLICYFQTWNIILWYPPTSDISNKMRTFFYLHKKWVNCSVEFACLFTSLFSVWFESGVSWVVMAKTRPPIGERQCLKGEKHALNQLRVIHPLENIDGHHLHICPS